MLVCNTSRVVDPSILEDPQYRYFHFACKYRKKLAKYRSQLRRLGLDTGRILDIHYPAKGIVALLIHQEYSTDFLATLAKHKLEPITDFDQFAAANLNDPALLTLDDAARAAKARELCLE
ncbi:uncharacterized protein ATC70_002066 [Mucor velutinosus]|uniref:Uncharacterized protein n=1 Tax=Mucor velutinosus TaxID=708070 RepID=A0AAN7DDD5_9FUNG|nr:hypothetical protein ATC70_002066 [Mucor velutinosus]